MLSARMHNTGSSLSVRLTLWPVIIFSVFLAAILIAFYYIAKSHILRAVDDSIRFELEETRSLYRHKGLDPLYKHLVEEAEEYDETKSFFRIIDKRGDVIATSNLKAWKDLTQLPVSPNRLVKKDFARVLYLKDSKEFVRVLSIPLNDEMHIEGGFKLSNEIKQLNFYQYFLPLIGIAIVFLAALSAYLTSKSVTKRVDEMTKLANTFSLSQLGSRLPVGKYDDELSRLSTTFNSFLERIQTLVRGMKNVTDDIAHDLRMPIARMRSRAELAVSSHHIGGDPISEAANTLEECDHLLNLLNTMLDISEAEAKLVKLKKEEFDLDSLLKTAVELFETVAEEKHVKIDYTGVGPITIKGDVSKLQRAFSNLIDNAIKYTNGGGKVEVKVTRLDNDKIEVVISDSGIGISEEELPLVFERFYRADISRSGVGNGLGLTMSKALIEAHEGQLIITSQKGTGTVVKVVLKVS